MKSISFKPIWLTWEMSRHQSESFPTSSQFSVIHTLILTSKTCNKLQLSCIVAHYTSNNSLITIPNSCIKVNLKHLFWWWSLARGAIGSDTDRILRLPYSYPHPTFGYGYGYGYRYWWMWKNDIRIHQNRISDMDAILADRTRILIGYVKNGYD